MKNKHKRNIILVVICVPAVWLLFCESMGNAFNRAHGRGERKVKVFADWLKKKLKYQEE